MTVQAQDWFVGGVGVVLGLTLVAAAAVDSERFFQLRKPSWIAARCGRGRARCLFAGLGLLVTTMGVAIACGVRWH